MTSLSDLLRILRKVRPDHKFPEDFGDESLRDRMKLDNSRGSEILKTFGRPGWTSLEEVRDRLLTISVCTRS